MPLPPPQDITNLFIKIFCVSPSHLRKKAWQLMCHAFFKLSYHILFCYFSAATTPDVLFYRFTEVELKN